MADTALRNIANEVTDPTGVSYLYIEDDTGGTPADGKITPASLLKNAAINAFNGLDIEHVSPTQIKVRAGTCFDASGNLLTLAADQTLDITVDGDLDQKTLTGTGTIATSTITSVSGLTKFLTEFAGNDTPRALTGTFKTVGTALTCQGDGDPGLDKAGIGDLIGNAANGYSRVSVAPDYSPGGSWTATLAVALPGGDVSVAAAFNAIENPTILFGANHEALQSITSDTVCTIVATATGSGQTMKAIAETVSRWYYIWLIAGTCYLSTQRTTPYTSGNACRIGTFRSDSSSNIPATTWNRSGRSLRSSLTGTIWLNSGSASVVTRTSMGDVVPPTSRWLESDAVLATSPGTADEYVSAAFYIDSAGAARIGIVDGREDAAAGLTFRWDSAMSFPLLSGTGDRAIYYKTSGAGESVSLYAKSYEELL